MDALSRLFKHTIIYGIATVVPKLLNVALQPLLVNYLPSKDDFGITSLVFVWIVLANVVLTYGMETAFFRFFSDPTAGSKAAKTALAAVFTTTIIVALLAFLNIEWIANTTQIAKQYWPWIIGIVAFDTLMAIPFAMLRAQGKTMRFAMVKIINVFISICLTVLFYTLLPSFDSINAFLPSDRIALLFIAFFAASLLTFVLVMKPYFDSWEFDWTICKKMLRYGFPVLIAGLAFAVNETFDKLLLQWLMPQDIANEQVAIYSGCYRLAIGMTLYATAFKMGVEPFFFSESRNDNAKKMYAEITKAFVLLGSIALFLYVIVVDLIKLILLPKEEYWVAMDVVPPVLIAFLFFGIYQSLSVWYKVTDRTRFGAVISVIGAGATIILNLIFIPIIGFMACAITTCVAYGLMMVLSYLLGRKYYKVPYDMKSIGTSLLTSIVFSLFYFYYLRKVLGVHSLELYAIGFVMSGVLLGIIWKGNTTYFKTIIAQKWK